MVAEAWLEGSAPTPRFVDSCLESPNWQRRLPAIERDTRHALVWSYARQLACLDAEARLVHGDFGKRNLLMGEDDGRWVVAGGSSGSSPCLALRWARPSPPLRKSACPVIEAHFSTGYLQAGGGLPHDWRRLARIVDLTALCESLTHDELPGAIVGELVELISAAVRDRDPRLGQRGAP